MDRPEMHPSEFQARREAGEELFLLDVREPDEVAEWSFPGAVNIPLGDLGARAGDLPIDRVIVVACQSGIRSARATHALAAAGFPAHNLYGGALEWRATEGTSPGD